MSAHYQVEMSAVDLLAGVNLDKHMSQKEVGRVQLLDLVKSGQLHRQEAAHRLGITARHLRRVLRRYREEGVSGLINKQRGRPSNRRLSVDVAAAATALIGQHYADFGPTLAAEKLRERHAIALSVERVRQLMMAAGYWRARVGAKPCVHPLRERRARYGEMVQIDGSPHDGFEGRAAYCTLLVFIDDATGRLQQLRFVPSETTLGYLQVLHDYVRQYGVPGALYSDKHSIFRINAKDAAADAQTQFARAVQELGSLSIHANSPQAKGRVERANQTLQDRLVKDMRLQDINDMAHANAWLPHFIADHNRRFAVAARDASDAHIAYTGSDETLRRRLSVQVVRTLSKNLSCQFEGQLLQVEPHGSGRALRAAKVTLHQHIDGRKELVWQGRSLSFSVQERPLRQAPEADSKSVNARVDAALIRRSPPAPKPAKNHPWKKAIISPPASDGRQVSPLTG